MAMRRIDGAVLTVSALFGAGAAHAQFGRGVDWWTAGGDAQRSSWVRTDPKISVQSLQKPGFAVTWKIKLNGEPSVAATLDRYIGYRGFRSFAFMGSASGEITTIDTDLGRVEWHKKLEGGAAGRATGACAGGMTANVARPAAVAFPAAPAGRGGMGGGRGGPAKSEAGQPGEGAVTIAAALAASNAVAARGPAPGMPGGPGAAGRGRGMRMPDLLSAISSDGMYHAMYVSNGEEPNPPIAFLPPNANAHELTIVDAVAYAATSRGCGGAPNAVWALDIPTKEVAHWAANGDIAGGGFAFGPDAKIYAATSKGDLVALGPKKLEPQGVYRAENAAFTTSPVVFEYKTKAIVAAATQDEHIHIVDGVTLTGSAYPASVSGALASWQDAAGTRWIVAPSMNSISAWKLEGESPALETGWTSAEMASPIAPIVVNGVVFAVSNSPNAVLHALDGATGKELWNSGRTLTAAVRIGGLSAIGSQVYLGASDGIIYAFGFPIEH
jgi:outer membrane protein assembly factor BamB